MHSWEQSDAVTNIMTHSCYVYSAPDSISKLSPNNIRANKAWTYEISYQGLAFVFGLIKYRLGYSMHLNTLNSIFQFVPWLEKKTVPDEIRFILTCI